MYSKWFPQEGFQYTVISINVALLLLLSLSTTNWRSSADTVMTSCEWSVSANGQMTCHVTYSRVNCSQDGQEQHQQQYQAPVSSKAACQWPSSMTEEQQPQQQQLSRLQKVIVFCDYLNAVGRPIMDSDTFRLATSLQDIDIRHVPIRYKLPTDTFCNVPKLHTLAIRHSRLEDMDHIGLGNCSNAASNLKELWLSSNQIRVIRDRGPLRSMTQLDTLGMDDNKLEDIHTEAFVSLVNLDSMFLLNNSLTHLAPGTFKALNKLTLLDISINRLTNISAGVFQGLDNLIMLALDKNRITRLTRESFLGMPNLQHLDLAHNNIVDIQEGTLDCLTALLFLDLTANNLTEFTIRNGSIGLPHLTNLYLSQNRFSVIDVGTMSLLPALEKMFIYKNLVRTLPSNTFQHQTKLLHLELYENLIERIDVNAFSETNVLERLRLDSNRLTAIPDLRRLQHLRRLDLSDNLVSDVPRHAFSHILELQSLNLRGNRIQILGDYVLQNLVMLSDIDMANNRLTFVGNDTFTGLNRLTTLNLENNQLDLTPNIYNLDSTYNRTLPMLDVYRNLRNLETVNLSGNGLVDFRYHWFPANLKKLDLSRNAIANVNGPLVRFDFPTLRQLDLSSNVIDRIEPGSFPFTLQTLKLDDNRIDLLHNNTFKYMTVLHRVSLVRNRIRYIDVPSAYFVDGPRGPVQLTISGNPLVCDCRLDWIRAHNRATNYEIEDVDEVTCEPGFDKWQSTVAIPTTTLPHEYFLCTFQEHFMSSRACLLAGSTGHRYCIYACPQQCRCYRSAQWKWITLDCSSSNLVVVPSDLPLDTHALYLDGNKVNRIGADHLAWLTSLQRLYLNHNVIEELQPRSFTSVVSLQVLYLDHNELTSLSDQTLFEKLVHLVTLELSHNRLTNLSERIFEPLVKLKTLNLANNLLVSYPVWSLDSLPRLSDVGLYANPWSCECEYAWSYRRWIGNFTGRLMYKGDLYCVKDNDIDTGPGNRFVSLITFNISDCYEGTVKADQVMTILVSSDSVKYAWLATFPVIIMIVSVMVFVYRREVQVLIYSHYGMRIFHKSDEQYDANKQYDAFVSYSTLDEEFVVRQLLPGLEDIVYPYKLCLHHRDFPIGAFINESIFDSIATSRRTILVLSDNFVRSEWCRFEFRTAHSQMLLDRCKRVIVIVYGEIPDNLDDEMKLYMRTNTYVVWGDRLFWKKLYFVLPERPPQRQ